jgi:hypothetical protein
MGARLVLRAIPFPRQPGEAWILCGKLVQEIPFQIADDGIVFQANQRGVYFLRRAAQIPLVPDPFTLLPQRPHYLLDDIAPSVGAIDPDVGPAVLRYPMPEAIRCLCHQIPREDQILPPIVAYTVFLHTDLLRQPVSSHRERVSRGPVSD